MGTFDLAVVQNDWWGIEGVWDGLERGAERVAERVGSTEPGGHFWDRVADRVANRVANRVADRGHEAWHSEDAPGNEDVVVERARDDDEEEEDERTHDDVVTDFSRPLMAGKVRITFVILSRAYEWERGIVDEELRKLVVPKGAEDPRNQVGVGLSAVPQTQSTTNF